MDEMLTIRLDAETARALEQEARRTNRSKGRVVRDALNAHLRESPHSALQGLAKYAGCMTGPPDLSTSKRHLKGLGRTRRR
jgi:hypothetical protein